MSSLSTGMMQFFDNAVPALEAADYNIVVTQQIDVGDGECQQYVFNQPMTVDGPHLALGSGDVVSVYPPSGSQADYSESLAHVVLNRRTLPWEINPGLASLPPGTTWLALLLLQPAEIVWPGGGSPVSPSPAGAGTGTQTVALADYVTPPPGTLGPELSDDELTEWGEQYPNASVTVVDVEWNAFTAIAPQLAELPFLSHVREINTGGATIMGVDEDGWYSVVVGNRLPSGTGMYIAHLVSLEGFTSCLPGSSSSPPDTSPPLDAVRLISLTSWTFNTMPGPDFTALMDALDVGVLRMPIPKTGPFGKLIDGPLRAGYTAIEYQTRLGEPTTAWYRGPCLPVWSERNMQPLYPNASAALVYDQRTGMFDVSFAVAWQTGRQLALANRQFVTSLLNWINENNSIAELLDEQLIFFQNFASPPEPDLDLQALRAPQAIHRALPRILAKLYGAFGPPADRRGLGRRRGNLRGLLSRAELDRIAASGAEPHAAVVNAVRAKRRMRR